MISTHFTLIEPLLLDAACLNLSACRHPELERFVQEKVAGGIYISASEVIRESLRLMHACENVQKQGMGELRRIIDIGMEQLHQKQVVDGLASRENIKRSIDAIVKGKG